jgi:hypothetical protein
MHRHACLPGFPTTDIIREFVEAWASSSLGWIPTLSKIVPFPGRRNFLKASATLTAGAAGLGILSEPGYSEDTELFIVGPKQGYTPQIGTLVSEMAFMQWQVMNSVKGTSQKDLDFLLDDKANRIGALLLHLVATEKFYQLNTLDGLAPNKMPES